MSTFSNLQPVCVITGIDTGVGKTIVTGQLAKYLQSLGISVITQKIVQTGCSGLSEDIVKHREIMQVQPYEEDYQGLTCPYVLKKASSPHLAARLEKKIVQSTELTGATSRLQQKFKVVLVEGAGGIMVPITPELTIIDYIRECNYPVIVVTTNKLGSINHTLMTLEVLQKYHVKISGVIYNTFFNSDREITEDTRGIIGEYLNKIGLKGKFFDLDDIQRGGCRVNKPNDTHLMTLFDA